MENKTLSLIEKIQQKTEEGNAKWVSGSSETQYRLKLPSGTVLVDKFRDVAGPGPEPSVHEGFSIDILDNKGDEVKSISRREDGKRDEYEVLKRLWDMADRSYKNLDEVLDSMIEDVESEGEIGEDAEETFEPDDDLPF